ncbi:MAG: hypothetical protein EBX50_18665 [Chitinophagia bacterium]|nr:hypothetical protein [Chitinophagia bacterium]
MKNAKIPNMKIYALLFPFALGVFITVFVYQAITIYQLRSTVAEDHTTLTNVVTFLNNQIQAAQGQVPAKANVSAAPAASSSKK